MAGLWRYPALLVALLFCASASAAIDNLRVEYRDNPIGLEVSTPRFSWQTTSAAGVRGVAQSAYRITVKDPAGSIVWDSGRVADSRSLDVAYGGAPLKPATRYDWLVTAWQGGAAESSAQAWFETGLMNPDAALSGWDGASWIGGSAADRVLYAQYLPLFDLNFALTISPGSHRAAIVLAANDPRLMDRNKNIYGLQNARNASYFKVELDLAGVDAGGGESAVLNVYRAGYSTADSPGKPFKVFKIKDTVINRKNAHSVHRVSIRDEFGELTFHIDGSDTFHVPEAGDEGAPAGLFDVRKKSASINLNPAGTGHDYLTYGLLCEMGFAMDAGQSASFSEVTVSDTRQPANAVFREDLTRSPYGGIYKGTALRVAGGAYSVSGGRTGVFIVADPSHNAMPMLRTTFDVKAGKVTAARLYATARGIYELYLNGKRVGEDYYNPGLTQYNVTHLYQTYDVTSMVTTGKNALGAMLGEGWWSGLLSYGNLWNYFGDRQSLLAKLVLTYEDGSREVITTNDNSWKYFNEGPVVYSSLDMGEVYDATRDAAIAGWSTSAYDDHGWHTAVRVPLEGTAHIGRTTDMFGRTTDVNFDHLSIRGQIGESAKIYQVLTARRVTEVRKGVYVYDMGQNLVGVPRIRFEQGEPGKRVTFRVSEMLYPKLAASGDNVGMIMTENYRAALSQDQYVMKSGPQQFQPRFTSHGYQYLEISGLDEPLPLDQVQAVVISSLQRVTASYQSSNPAINSLWSNLVWSNVDNFLTIPTDCPQRNERMGWSGDISVFSRTATYVSNAAPFLQRHMLAMRDTQLPSGKFTDIAPVGGGGGGLLWGSAGITVAWEAYQQYADTRLLREHYAAMASYMDHLAASIDPKTGLSTDVLLGDWLGPQDGQLGAAFPATAYHIYDLAIMMQVADVLGRFDDVEKYRRMYFERKEFFNRTFVNADKKTLGFVGKPIFPGGPPAPGTGAFKVADTQTSYAVGLALGAFSNENIPYMQKNLAAAVERENTDDRGVTRPPYSLMTGFIGTAWISKALSAAGRADLAYRVLQNRQYPSWVYPIDQGATTIWERLNGYTVENGFGGNNSMNSFNHYSFGAVGQWLMAYSLGIQRGEPGFKSFVLQPEPDPTGQMTWAKGHYDSEYGRIESAWSIANGMLTYAATVPANTTATLYLPTHSARTVQEGGRPAAGSTGVTFKRYEKGRAVYQLASGTYQFTATP
ncbi:MAG: alpha-L-rhamnosidase [Gammaproteobacteria bacterium]|nr:alpha-L-rhamnosidase [Gammaproteobacteria bacterium]